MDWLENAQDSAHIIIVNAGGCQRTDNCGRRTSHQQPNITYQCTVPHFIFLASMAIGLEKFTFRTACGLLVGFLGVIFIFWDGFHDLLNPGYRLGILTLIIAVMSWDQAQFISKNYRLRTEISFSIYFTSLHLLVLYSSPLHFHLQKQQMCPHGHQKVLPQYYTLQFSALLSHFSLIITC